MKDTIKKYIKVSLTLGIIAGGSALLIGLTNAITKDKIILNSQEKENNGLKNVFADVEDETFAEVELEKDYTYIEKIFTVNVDNKQYGTIYKTSGKNAYGNISLLLGFNLSNEFTNMVVLENTETYGSTLEENYIDKVNSKQIEIEDVSCGATFGAKLIKNMVDEAKLDLASKTK